MATVPAMTSAAAVVAAASTTATSTTATATTARAWTTISAVAAIAGMRRDAVGSVFAVKVWFFALGFLFKVAAALDGDGSGLRLSDGYFAAAHLGALLFEDGFAREADAVAFDCKDFHENLIALFEFVADVLDAMLGDLTDVEEAIGAGQDFDEGSEVRQS